MKTPKHAKLDEDNVQSHDFALLVLEVKIKNILKQAYTLFTKITQIIRFTKITIIFIDCPLLQTPAKFSERVRPICIPVQVTLILF